jgi:hypothetical protein
VTAPGRAGPTAQSPIRRVDLPRGATPRHDNGVPATGRLLGAAGFAWLRHNARNASSVKEGDYGGTMGSPIVRELR